MGIAFCIERIYPPVRGRSEGVQGPRRNSARRYGGENTNRGRALPEELAFLEYKRELLRIVNRCASPVRIMGALKGRRPKCEGEESTRHADSPR